MESLNYPASMSAFLYDQDYKILMKDRELQFVEKFKYESDFWAILYSQVPLTSEDEIVEALNKQIDEAGADGIINLKVTTFPCHLNGFMWITHLHLIPLLAGCAHVVTEGEIVKAVPKEDFSLESAVPEEETVLNNFISKAGMPEAIAKGVRNEL
jgi:hypothetical protein